jgi:hypothetical protein
MGQENHFLRFDIDLDGLNRVEEFDLSATGSIKVGKLSSSHLRLDHASVSRIHAVIEKRGGEISVIDLGSKEGTFLNDKKVTKGKLADGDVVRFGTALITVSFLSAEQGVPEATAAPEAAEVQEEAAPNDSSQGSGDGAEVVEAAADGGAAEEDTEDGAADGAADGADDDAVDGAVDTPTQGGLITLEDGSQVEPFTLQGYYDTAGNYIPGFYDQDGQYSLGYGYRDDDSQWVVVHGYYDPDGEWIESDEPVSIVGGEEYDQGPQSQWIFAGTRDSEVYQDSFFDNKGGDTLEVAMLWSDHVLAVTSYADPRDVTIGKDAKNDFVLDHVAIPSQIFPLISYDGSSYTVSCTDEMTGTVQVRDRQYSLDEAIDEGLASGRGGNRQIELTSRTSVRLDIGPTTFLMHLTDQPEILGAARVFDTAPVPYLVISAVAHILFVILAMTLPDAARRLDLDGYDANDRFVQLMLTPEQEEIDEPDWLGGEDDDEPAAKHKGEEGKAGEEDSEEVDKQLAIEGPKDNEDLELKRREDERIVMDAGIAGELMVSSPWGSSDNSVGSDAIHALGNLTGADIGEARGFGGLGMHGAGRGGGGVSERGLGMSNIGTSGKGGRGRGGSGYGRGAGDLGEKNTRVPQVIGGKPQVRGSLDKEIIRRVVRQHRKEIKYCYEKELQKNKNLKGRVVVKFTISATGSVVSALVKETTLNSAGVERCMTTKIRRWVFPEPKGGGIVIVKYPFNLSH